MHKVLTLCEAHSAYARGSKGMPPQENFEIKCSEIGIGGIFKFSPASQMSSSELRLRKVELTSTHS